MFLWIFQSLFLGILNLQFKLSNDPTLSSLPLLSTFLKAYSHPYLGLTPPSTKQIPPGAEPGTLSSTATSNAQEYTAGVAFPSLVNGEEELVEKDVKDRFKKMCEGYFDNVTKKLVIEHKVLFIDIPLLICSLIKDVCRNCKTRTAEITRRTSARVRYSRIDSRRTRR